MLSSLSGTRYWPYMHYCKAVSTFIAVAQSVETSKENRDVIALCHNMCLGDWAIEARVSHA
ncbi:hypothetical protein Leryth_012834 [Lithospermum erythrorhizon]|nr:hypothetical protein Leryth_012834 [Lithospermum erythrorhizon]